MKRTWQKIIIISFAVIFVEVLGTILFLHPYYKIQRVFDSIDDGQRQNTQDYYEALNTSGKEKVNSYLYDYGRYLCQRYIDGEITYEQISASFDAIDGLDETGAGALTNEYRVQVNYNEFKATVRALYEAGQKYDNDTYYAMNNRLRLLQQYMDSATRETIMVEMLNEYYQSFLNEEITAEQTNAFVNLILGISYYDAYNYAAVVMQNVSCVINYRELYNEAYKKYQNEEYFWTIEACRAVNLDPCDTKYKDMFETLYSNAYGLGKIHYGDLLDEYITAGEQDKTVALMNSIEKYYGEDFDLSEIKERIAEDWQLAYIDLLNRLDASLQTELGKFETGQYILQNEYDNLKPDRLVLHDVDGDGTPELFLYNSAHAGDEYIGSFIYTYSGGKCSFVGFVNVKSFCRDSNLIGFPIAFGRSAGDECSLVQYDGSTVTQVSYCQEIGGTYYVNGAEVNDVDYLSARTSILSHADAYNVGNSKYAGLSDGESFILAYKK